jgi:hypothetical protein
MLSFFSKFLSSPGDPAPKVREAMEAEHCHKSNNNSEFTAPNYGVTTSPRKEWSIILDCDESIADMRHGRRIPKIADLMASDSVKQANLTEEEVIAVILYTGPMVRLQIPRPFPRPFSPCA